MQWPTWFKELGAGDKYLEEDKFISKMAVSDSRLITANGTASLEFAKEVLLSLKSIPNEAIKKWYQFHKLGYYTIAWSTLVNSIDISM